MNMCDYIVKAHSSEQLFRESGINLKHNQQTVNSMLVCLDIPNDNPNLLYYERLFWQKVQL